MLNSFKVDAGTGALSAVQTINYSYDAASSQLAVHPSGTYLYNTAGPCVLAYTIDPATGNLSQSSCSVQAVGPLTVAPPGNFAYSGTQSPDTSYVNVYAITQSDGSLTLLQSVVSAGNGGVLASDPQGRALYELTVPNMPFQCGQLELWSIDQQTGGLTPVNSSFNPQCVPSSISFDPGDHFAYVTAKDGDQGLQDGVFAATVDASGNLTDISGSPFAANTQAQMGAVEPSMGKYLLEINAGSPGSGFQVIPFSIDSNTGKLTQVANAATAIGGSQYQRMVVVAPMQ